MHGGEGRRDGLHRGLHHRVRGKVRGLRHEAHLRGEQRQWQQEEAGDLVLKLQLWEQRPGPREEYAEFHQHVLQCVFGLRIRRDGEEVVPGGRG